MFSPLEETHHCISFLSTSLWMRTNKWLASVRYQSKMIHTEHYIHFPVTGNIQIHFVWSKSSCYKKNDLLRIRTTNFSAVLTRWRAAERRKGVFLCATALSLGLEAKPAACCEVLLSCRRAPGTKGLLGESQGLHLSWHNRSRSTEPHSWWSSLSKHPLSPCFRGFSF